MGRFLVELEVSVVGVGRALSGLESLGAVPDEASVLLGAGTEAGGIAVAEGGFLVQAGFALEVADFFA